MVAKNSSCQSFINAWTSGGVACAGGVAGRDPAPDVEGTRGGVGTEVEQAGGIDGRRPEAKLAFVGRNTIAIEV